MLHFRVAILNCPEEWNKNVKNLRKVANNDKDLYFNDNQTAKKWNDENESL